MHSEAQAARCRPRKREVLWDLGTAGGGPKPIGAGQGFVGRLLRSVFRFGLAGLLTGLLAGVAILAVIAVAGSLTQVGRLAPFLLGLLSLTGLVGGAIGGLLDGFLSGVSRSRAA